MQQLSLEVSSEEDEHGLPPLSELLQKYSLAIDAELEMLNVSVVHIVCLYNLLYSGVYTLLSNFNQDNQILHLCMIITQIIQHLFLTVKCGKIIVLDNN